MNWSKNGVFGQNPFLMKHAVSFLNFVPFPNHISFNLQLSKHMRYHHISPSSLKYWPGSSTSCISNLCNKGGLVTSNCSRETAAGRWSPPLPLPSPVKYHQDEWNWVTCVPIGTVKITTTHCCRTHFQRNMNYAFCDGGKGGGPSVLRNFIPEYFATRTVSFEIWLFLNTRVS